MAEGSGTEVEEAWTLPNKWEAPERPNFFLYAFRVWWMSLVVSLVCWCVFMFFYATDDVFMDVMVFGGWMAALGALFYSVLFLFIGLPFFGVCCLKPGFWFSKPWLMFLCVVVLALLGTEMGAQALAGESALADPGWFAGFGLAYGIVTGAVAWLRAPGRFRRPGETADGQGEGGGAVE